MKRLAKNWRTLFTICFIFGLCNFAQADSELFNADIVEFTNASFACGDGWIEISFENGEAKFINCNPSEASKHIWEGLKPYFEEWKKDICKD